MTAVYILGGILIFTHALPAVIVAGVYTASILAHQVQKRRRR